MFFLTSIMLYKVLSAWTSSKHNLLYLSTLSVVSALSLMPIHSINFCESSVFLMDQISFPIIMMTLLLMMALEITNMFSLRSNLLMALSVLTFMASKMISFYILFELNLIPIFLIVLGWGYQPERLFASKSMMFYTLAGSLPLLLLIIMHPSMNQFNSNFISGGMTLSTITMLFLSAGFLVKLPIFSLHLWLPLAHVEAPIMGSMILAGILLKLGGYGLIRVVMMFSDHLFLYSPLMLVFCSVGAAVALLFCITQVDLKIIIAYSSVGHMSIATASVYSLSSTGMSSSLINLVTHGFASSLMFFIASIMYKTSKTRHILLNKGMLCLSPIMVAAWFINCLMNAGGPPSMNLLAEILATISILNLSIILVAPMFVYLMVGMLFNMKIFSISSQGNPQEAMITPSSLSFSESMSCAFHIMASVVMLASMFFMVI